MPAIAGEAPPDLERAASAPISPRLGTKSDQDARVIRQVAQRWFKAEWQAYASTFITAEGRVLDNANGDVSHSEGQGYGLLLANLAGDGDRFEAIWRWTEKNLAVRPDGLLSWKWDPKKGEIADKNNATDGDILVAWALAEAAQQFGREDYRIAAKAIARAIGAQTFRTGEGGPILLPAAAGFAASDQPDGPIINLSYWVFPAFPVLKALAPGYDWDALRENGLKLLVHSRFGPLRLPSDWQSVASKSPAPAKGFLAQFGYNAIRIPLYLAWDGGEGSREALRRFAPLWSGKDGVGPFIIDIKSGSASQPFDGLGYRLVLALAGCATSGQPIDPRLISSRDRFYYPETLRLLAAAVIQERYPQCL